MDAKGWPDHALKKGRRQMGQAFAVWLTGPPASGKSAIAKVLKERVANAGLVVEVLESDLLRRIVTPEPTYSLEERELFYRSLAFFGSRMVAHGISVIFDATAHRRLYRNLARASIPHFLEVSIVCPIEVRRQRDHKGIYKLAAEGKTTTVPGLQEPYEPPDAAELEIDTTAVTPERAADHVMGALEQRGYLTSARADAE